MSKPDACKLSHTLCFSCAQIFPADANDPKTCPSCGFSLASVIYHRIMTYAISAVYYGHDYRIAYERQLSKQGKITERYALPDSATLLCFCGAAALSGIIGGIAYDIVKKAMRAAIDRSRIIDKDIGQPRVSLDKDADLDSFIQYIQEYYKDPESIDNAVRVEIEKEEIVWILSEETSSLFSGTSSPTKEEIVKIVRKAYGKARKPEYPSKDDFIHFWEQLHNKPLQ